MKPNKQSHGFTLIELLVVIAIIAILAAILFPVFAQARTAAKFTSCLSHMKQFGTAFQMYLQDNNDRYPKIPQYNINGNPMGFIPVDALKSYTKSENLFWDPMGTPQLKATLQKLGCQTSYMCNEWHYDDNGNWVCFEGKVLTGDPSTARLTWDNFAETVFYDQGGMHYNALFCDGHAVRQYYKW